MAQKMTCKIRFGKGEYGWVEFKGRGKWVVTNVPFMTKLDVNRDDVVTLKEVKNDFPRVDEVISRKYHKRFGVQYEPPTAPAFKKLATALRKDGDAVEGAVAGMAVVASNRTLTDLKARLKVLKGVTITRADYIQRYAKI